jgi:PKD repeat protein
MRLVDFKCPRAANGRATAWRRILRFARFVAAAAAALAVVVTPAQAVIVRTGAGHPVSYQPTVAQAAVTHALAPVSGPHRATSSRTSTYKQCASFEAACLTYFGGPVMRTTTLTPIFWEPEGLGLKYPTGFEAEIEQFFTDLAADSGKETNFFSLLPQYYDTVGGGTHHVNYSVTAGAPLKDTDALPKAAEDLCTTPFEGTSRPCVSDVGVRAELESFIKGGGLATGMGHEYVVFFPDGIDSCFGEGGPSHAEECSGSAYCGYHGTVAVSATEKVQYANEPENGDPQYGGNCSVSTSLKAGYRTINTASHEISESVTDPEVGEPALSWYDFHESATLLGTLQYAEIGDICAWEFKQGDDGLAWANGGGLDAAGTSDQEINGHPYLLQTEWDNAHSTCSLTGRTSNTHATFTDSASASVSTGEQVSFDGSDSYAPVAISAYEWNWGDGTHTTSGLSTAEHSYANTEGTAVKTFIVTLRIIDANGNSNIASKAVEVDDRKPAAEFTVPTPTVGVPTTFDGSLSSDIDGTISSYVWSFGDGSTGTGATPAHAYAIAGQYTVRLTVTDDGGLTASTEHTITALAPPPLVHSIAKEAPFKSSPLTVIAVKQNKKTGILTLTLQVPGAGRLQISDGKTAKKARRGHKRPQALVKSLRMALAQAGIVTVQLLPSALASRLLGHQHAVPVRALIVFTPTGGKAVSLTKNVVLKKTAKRRK